MQITPLALRELAMGSVQPFPVSTPSTKIFKKSGEVRLLVKLHVEQDCKVKAIRSQLREKLEVVMVNNLNFIISLESCNHKRFPGSITKLTTLLFSWQIKFF